MHDSRSDILASAFDRIDDFLAVQSAAGGISIEAVNRLQEAVGIGDPSRVLFKERLEHVSADAHCGQVLFGLILGLLVAQEGDATR